LTSTPKLAWQVISRYLFFFAVSKYPNCQWELTKFYSSNCNVTSVCISIID
jgi:hypothetical protein